MRGSAVVTLLLGGAALLMVACKSGEGAPCQKVDDCREGLMCDDVGTCQTPESMARHHQAELARLKGELEAAAAEQKELLERLKARRGEPIRTPLPPRPSASAASER